jgi:hypothetical protein
MKNIPLFNIDTFIQTLVIALSVQRWSTVGRPWNRVLFLAGARDFSILPNVHTGSGAHTAFYTTATGFCFL